MERARQGGFSVVELSAVLAATVTLAAFMFPVLARARARSRQALCASHLAQIARAGLLYVQDYDERFPSCYPQLAPPYYIDPRTTLQPYLQNWEIFYCPDRHTVRPECLDPSAGFRSGSRCMGYGYNWGSGLPWAASYAKGDGLVRDMDGRGEFVVGVTLMEVEDPAHCFFYGDTNDYLFVTLLREAMPGVRKNGDPAASLNGVGDPYEPPRHGEGNNFVFVDGHVEWLRFPGGLWVDGGPWVVPDMSMYSRTGRWETAPVP
jgi:prepilin-type processing-associated H-X9-DG protein